MYPDLITRAFAFSNENFVRLHGPAEYTYYTSYKPWLRDEFKFRISAVTFRPEYPGS
jgi:hypothetical protein